MWTSRADKGFTLVEVMVSLGIFALLFSGALAVMLGERKLEHRNRETIEKTAFLEALRGAMADDTSYDELLELKNKGRLYIAEGAMDMDNLRETGPSVMFSDQEPAEGCFISMHVAEGPVLEAELRLHLRTGGRTELVKTVFYKGSCRR